MPSRVSQSEPKTSRVGLVPFITEAMTGIPAETLPKQRVDALISLIS